MTASSEFEQSPAYATCPLCDQPVSPADERCAACGYHLAGVGGRPGPFSRAALWWTAAGLVFVYLVTLLIVALTN
jgi:predicted amidophosphoribosyltransferase